MDMLDGKTLEQKDKKLAKIIFPVEAAFSMF